MIIKNVFDKKRLMAFVEGYTNAIDGAEINICPFAMSIQNLAMFLPDYDAEEFRKNFFCGWKSVFVCDGAFAGQGVLCGQQGTKHIPDMECVETLRKFQRDIVSFLNEYKGGREETFEFLRFRLIKLGTIREDLQLSDEEILAKAKLFADALIRQAIGDEPLIRVMLCTIAPKEKFFGKVS